MARSKASDLARVLMEESRRKMTDQHALNIRPPRPRWVHDGTDMTGVGRYAVPELKPKRKKRGK